MKIVLYTRCSTEEQKSTSHEYQINGLRRHARYQDCEEVFLFSDTITGTSFFRPEFEKMYNLCKIDRSIKFVIVYKWDRFGRDSADGLLWIRKFRDLGVEVNCFDQWIDFNDPNYPVLLNIHLAIAQTESLKISDRTRDGMYQANIDGFWTASAVPGYIKTDTGLKKRNGDKRKVLVKDPIKARIIKKCFEEINNGVPQAELYKTYGKKLGVTKSSFNRIFTRVVYAGYIDVKEYKGNPAVRVKGQHEPIISMLLFKNVQYLIDGKRKVSLPKNDLYLKGVLSKDGKLFTAYKSKGKSGGHFGYYDLRVKPSHILNADKCHAQIERIIKLLDEVTLPDEVFQGVLNRIDDTFKDIELELSVYKKKRSTISGKETKLQQKYIEDKISEESYLSFKEMLSDEAVKIDLEIDQLQAKVDKKAHMANVFANTFKNISKIFFKANNDGRLRFLKAVFPEGFWFEKQDYSLRTPCINNIIYITHRETAFCENINNKKGSPFSSDPVGVEDGIMYEHLILFSGLLEVG